MFFRNVCKFVPDYTKSHLKFVNVFHFIVGKSYTRAKGLVKYRANPIINLFVQYFVDCHFLAQYKVAMWLMQN